MDCFVAHKLRSLWLAAVLSGPWSVVLLLGACGGGSGVDAVGQLSATVGGVVQKGPFVAQVPVHLYQLNNSGARTGNSVTTYTDTRGAFNATVPWRGATEAEARGLFYDELNAANSVAPRTLNAFFLADDDVTVHLNLFSRLAAARARHLMLNGAAITDALNQANADLQTTFQLQFAAATGAHQLDLTQGTGSDAPDNANLLLFSAAMLSAGVDDAGLDALTVDFADDGAIDAAALGDWLRVRVMATTFSLDAVGLNIQNLAWVADAPDFSDLNNTYPAWVDSPGDADSDGLSDRDEILLTLTDPLDADTDQDSLADGAEVNTHGTDPLDADTDDDLMSDAWEIAGGLNPLLDDAAGDADGDGLSNLAEFQNRTDPQLGDSDGDGYSDSQELADGGDPLDAASLPLAFVSSPSLSIEATDNYSYTAMTTWPAAVLTLSVNPPAMTLSGGATASWTPAMHEFGNHTITLTASARGYHVSQSWSLAVTPFNTGDVNEDGFVDARDSLLAQRIALGLMSPTITEFNRADVQLDGTIDAGDVVLIERVALGL